jgi:hypothetical protein
VGEETETRIYDELGLEGRMEARTPCVNVRNEKQAAWKSKSFSEGSKEGVCVCVCVCGSMCTWIYT